MDIYILVLYSGLFIVSYAMVKKVYGILGDTPPINHNSTTTHYITTYGTTTTI